MKNLTRLVLMLCAFSLCFSSCVSKKKWEELVAQKTSLESNLSETKTQMTNLESDLEGLKAENLQMEEDYAADKKQLKAKIGQIESDLNMVKKEKKEVVAELKSSEAKIKDIASTLQKPFTPFTAKGFTMASEGNMLYVNGLRAIQYKSGSARVTKDSKEILDGIAEILVANPGMHLLIEGHTDNVPMKEGARYASNEELSMARAKSVVKYLVKHGASATQLTATGHGSSKPKMAYSDSGPNLEAQSVNRRAEIIVMTSPTNIYNLSQTL